MSEAEALLRVEGLTKHFPIRGGMLRKDAGTVRAVDGISFSIPKGKTLGLVGESGCGKTTVGRTLMRLVEPTAGRILFEGRDITHANRAELRDVRRGMQMVFQDPMSSLDPRMTVKDIVGEPLRINGAAKRGLEDQVLERLRLVNLTEDHLHRFPHELSGGQRQRVGLARALALEPRFIVLDEPTSALDVSVQSQILNLLLDLQRRLGLSYLFISHDLAVVRHVADHVAVMYLGKIAEYGPTENLFRAPQHPYTNALLAAVPVPDPELKRKRIVLKGDVPSPANPPAACRFHPRCPRMQPVCAEVRPKLELKDGTYAACHFPGTDAGVALR